VRLLAVVATEIGEFDRGVGASAKVRELLGRLWARIEATSWSAKLSAQVRSLWAASGLTERLAQFQDSVEARYASEGGGA